MVEREEAIGTKPSNAPPHYVKFDMSDDAAILQRYFRECVGERGHARMSQLHVRFEFLTNPVCRELGTHPKLVSVAREIMGFTEDQPIWLFGIKPFEKDAGGHHRIHSDVQHNTPSCKPHGSAVLWILLERSCPQDPSPLTLISGSHFFPLTADDDLTRRNCWYWTKAPPCNMSAYYAELESSNYFAKIVQGPTKSFTGIAWPSTTYHTTTDTCKRTAVAIEYAGSLACARSLIHRWPVEEAGRFRWFPDKNPLLRIGQPKNITIDEEERADPLFSYLSDTTVAADTDRCAGAPRTKTIQEGQYVQDHINKGGPFIVSDASPMQDVGGSLRPVNHRDIRSDAFAVTPYRLFWNHNKWGNLAHKPVAEKSLKVCAVLDGRVNIVMGTECREPFDAVGLEKGKVYLILPGILHTSSPDDSTDGEAVCFEITPLQKEAKIMPQKVPDLISVSRAASLSMDAEADRLNGTLTLFDLRKMKTDDARIAARVADFRHLLVKYDHFPSGGSSGQLTADYDLIVLPVSGSVNILSGSSTVELPKHHTAFIPAGVARGFSVTKGEALVLYIEIG